MSSQPGGVAIELRGGQKLGNGETAVVRAAQIVRNLIVDWRGGISIDGQPAVNVLQTTVHGNIVHDFTGSGAPLTGTRAGGQGAVAWSGNRYFSAGGSGLPHKVDARRVDFKVWRGSVGDPGSVSQTSVRPAPTIRLEDAVVPAARTYEEAWIRLRRLTRWNWDPALETGSIIERLRDKLGPQH